MHPIVRITLPRQFSEGIATASMTVRQLTLWSTAVSVPPPKFGITCSFPPFEVKSRNESREVVDILYE
jgi:hypothetical protein